MDNSEENAIRIADYLEDRMSPEQEEVFVRGLGDDPHLRQQFEDELLARALLSDDAGDSLEGSVRQPAAAERVELEGAVRQEAIVYELSQQTPERRTERPVRRRPLRTYYAAAAAVILAVAGTAIWIANRENRPGVSSAIPVISAKRDTAGRPPLVASRPRTDTGAGQSPILLMLTDNKEADSAFQANYSPYIYDSLAQAPDSDWLALRRYYDAYQRGDYDTVLMAKEMDHAGGPNIGEDDRRKQYMHFYKGLCYLASGTTADVMHKALAEFEPVLTHAPKGSPFFEAQWYALLTALRIGDLAKARALVNNVALSPSPYRYRAAALLNVTQ
jgi:hypothetical protein